MSQEPTTALDPPRIWVDDRHPVFRRGLVASLTAHGFHVAGESGGLVPTPPRDRLSILLFDANHHSLRTAIKVTGSDTRLVAMVRQADEQLLCDAVEAGVGAILLHADLTVDRLVGAMRVVAGGSTALPSNVLPRLLERAALGARGVSRAGLAQRDLDVLKLLAGGSDTREIATDLNYSERTVKNIVHDLLTKLNCRNRTHAVATATRQGII
jgi:DNA-binding NarL/FixJ family response regulator